MKKLRHCHATYNHGSYHTQFATAMAVIVAPLREVEE